MSNYKVTKADKTLYEGISVLFAIATFRASVDSMEGVKLHSNDKIILSGYICDDEFELSISPDYMWGFLRDLLSPPAGSAITVEKSTADTWAVLMQQHSEFNFATRDDNVHNIHEYGMTHPETGEKTSLFILAFLAEALHEPHD